MLGALNLQAQLSPSRFDVYDNDHPMLRDVIDCRPGELAQYREFLAAWRDALKKQHSDRADMLHLEALHLLEGVHSVGGRVRAWGGRQPRAWLFLIRLLALADDWPAAAAAAEQALAVVEHSPFRERIAEGLTEAGVKTHRPELVLTGRREAFFSLPGESRLLLLLEETGRQEQRAEELQKALSFLRSSRPPDGTPLHVKMLLMAGRLREAFDTARDEPALGWSYGQSAGGVLFAGIVSFLCLERIEAAPTVRRLLCRNVDGDRHEEESGAAAGVSVSGEILERLQGTTASQEELCQYRAWATSIGRKRIEQIVSNKHRGAYGRAAEVLGSLAELCALAGEAQQGRELIDEYRNRRFNRYAAFRRELDSVIASSATLKRILGAKER
jgi:hypothetical protein